MEEKKNSIGTSVLAGALAGAAAAAAVVGIYVFLKSERGQVLTGKAKNAAAGVVGKIKAKLPKRVVAETDNETVVLEG